MTIKPVLYGGVAAKFAPVNGLLSVVTGLGFVFLNQGFKGKLLRSLVISTYRLAFSNKNSRILFENPDDLKTMSDLGVLRNEQAELIRGAGVDLQKYAFSPETAGEPVVCLAARLLRDKGVVEFVEAANILRKKGIKARFQLIGNTDPENPATITRCEIEQWQQNGVVELLGFRADIPQVFANANIVVLPSHREGLPKVLLEAAACGRAVVTTDVPGCRHAIAPGVSGLLVPVQNPKKLAGAIEMLIKDPDRRLRMGTAGRRLAEEDFAIEKIVAQYLSIYKKLEPGK
jgi:glycosyltransferase involved in cell wall biosynthesis